MEQEYLDQSPVVETVSQGQKILLVSPNGEAQIDPSNLIVGANRNAAILALGGQSNMWGRGRPDNGYQTFDRPLSNMFQLSWGHNDLGYEATPLDTFMPAIQPIQSQVSQASNRVGSVCIGFYHAALYARNNPHIDVFIVQTSVGATGFSAGDWGVGDPLYNQAIEKISLTENHLVQNYDTVEMLGMLWHQGENDRAAIEPYTADITATFEGFRAAFNYGDFPIVVGAIGAIGRDDSDEINLVISELANSIPNVAFVDSSQRPLFDSNHFTGESLRLMGNDYYQAWLSLKESEGESFGIYNRVVSTPVDLSLGDLSNVSTEGSAIGDRLAQDTDGVWRGFEADEDASGATGVIREYLFNDLSDTVGNGANLSVVGVAPSIAGGVATFPDLAISVYESDAETDGAWTKIIRFRLDAAGVQTLVASDNVVFNINPNNRLNVSIGAANIQSSSNLVGGVWYVAALTYEPTGAISLILNGELVGVADNATVNLGLSGVTIGNNTPAVLSQNYSGEIDYVRIYDRAVSQVEGEFLTQ